MCWEGLFLLLSLYLNMTLKCNFLSLLIIFYIIYEKSKNFSGTLCALSTFHLPVNSTSLSRVFVALSVGRSAICWQRMGYSVFGFVWKRSYERKQIELISFPLTYIWRKQTVIVSSVISFVLKLQLFVNLFHSLHLVALEQSFPARVPHVGLRYMYAMVIFLSALGAVRWGLGFPWSLGPRVL